MSHWIGNLPAPLRHIVLLLISLGLTLAGGTQVDMSAQLEAITTAIVTMIMAWLTPLVQSYGVGKGSATR